MNTNNVTLYDLMAQDFELMLKKTSKGYDLLMQGEHENVEEQNIHPYAVESFADVCRGFLKCYEAANKSN